MAIYRGPGGGGDATVDAELNTFIALRDEALGYAADAEDSAAGALASENAAASSALAADASAVSAAASASSAASLYDSFDDRYLGAKVSDPTLDNDGNALIEGALYWDSVLNVMKAYDQSTSSWYQLSPTTAQQSNIDIVAANNTNVTTVATNIASVNTTAGSIANVNTTATNIASVNTTATNISNVNTTAGSIANVNTVATNVSNVNTVAGISANVTTVATNIASVNTNAANISAIQGAASNAASVSAALAQVNNGVKQRFVAGTDYVKNTTTSLTLSSTPAKGGFVQVYFDGLYRNINTFTLSGATITFTSAITSDTVEVAYQVPVTLTEDAMWRLADERLREEYRKEKNTPIKPTLLLDFDGDEVLDPRITFTRASEARFYDGRTVAKAEENLLTRSQEFDNAVWVNFNSADSANTTTAPDGTTTADTLNEGTSTGVHQITQAFAFLPGVNYTLSVYAKFVDNPYLHLAAVNYSNSNLYASAAFNIQTGTFITSSAAGSGYSVVGTPTISDAGNGWYRCSVVITFGTGSTTGNSAFFVYMGNSGAIGSFGGESYTGTNRQIQLWGAQLEQRSSVTAYTPTTAAPITNYIPVLQTAAANVARFDHNPLTGESLGLLIEEQRTNLLLRSEEFNDAYWTKQDATVTTNAVIAPDGTLTADKLVENTANASHIVERSSISAPSGSGYSFSCYAKRDGRNITLTLSDQATAQISCTFDLQNGTTTGLTTGGSWSGSSASIIPVGNGWFRCSVAGTKGAGSTARVQVILHNGSSNSYTGNGTSGIYIWGAQLEAGAFPTSYIPTVASQVTRSADVASMTGTNFSSWYRQDEGSLYVDMASEGTTGSKFHGVHLYGADNSSIILVANQADTRAQVFTTGFVQQALLATTLTASAKVAVAYKTNDIASSVNGGAAATDTSATLPTPVLMRIGWNNVSTQGARGYIRKIAYYPVRLSNAQLQAITT